MKWRLLAGDYLGLGFRQFAKQFGEVCEGSGERVLLFCAASQVCHLD